MVNVEFGGGPVAGQQLSWDPPLPASVWWFHAYGALGWAPTFVEADIPAQVHSTARYDLTASDEWSATYTYSGVL